MESEELLYHFQPDLSFDLSRKELHCLDLGCWMENDQRLYSILQKFHPQERLDVYSTVIDSEFDFPCELNRGRLIKSNMNIRDFLLKCKDKFDLIHSRNALDILQVDKEAELHLVDTYCRIFELLNEKGVALLITKREDHHRAKRGIDWFSLSEEQKSRIVAIQADKIKFHIHGSFDVCIMNK